MLSFRPCRRTNASLNFAIEQLEQRNLLTSVTFSEHEIVDSEHLGTVAAVPADVDGDGDLDIVSASYGDGKLAWYENTNSQGAFGNQKNIGIQTEIRRRSPVLVHDLDHDGDLDVILNARDLVWYENIDGRGLFGPNRTIALGSDIGIQHEHELFHTAAGDLDSDGDLDILVKHRQRSTWYENDGEGKFQSRHALDICGSGGIEVGDLDGDGDLDISAACGRRVFWYPNLDGQGDFSARKAVGTVRFDSISVVDMDGDEDLDILAWDRWFRNVDGRATFDSVTFSDEISELAMVDLDGDGDLDAVNSIFDGSSRSLAWRENLDGLGSFGNENLIPNRPTRWGPSAIFTGDLNNDGYVDLVSVSHIDGSIVWNANTDGHGTFGQQQVIAEMNLGTGEISTADIDGDGDMDVMFASNVEREIVWYENVDSQGRYGGPHSIGKGSDQDSTPVIPLFGNVDAQIADIDGDGDPDVIASWFLLYGGEAETRSIAWYQNKNGFGNFSEAKVIDEVSDDLRELEFADMDADGDIDVIVLSDYRQQDGFYSSRLNWYENLDGNGTFGRPVEVIRHPISSIRVADIDGDHDVDIMLVPRRNGRGHGVVWYENDGKGRFRENHVIFEDADDWWGERSANLADMDADGDVDVLSISYLADCETDIAGAVPCVLESMEMTWHENDGSGVFGTPNVVFKEAQINLVAPILTTTLDVADLNGDGFLDVIWPTNLVWFENNGVSEISYRRHEISAESAVAISVADIDGDSDVDVVSLEGQHCDGWMAFCSARHLVWHENRIIGDSNNDGVFDSADLVAIFAAGEYEDGIESNSTFAEGDWNGDGEFDSSDLVAAFQAATYRA